MDNISESNLILYIIKLLPPKPLKSYRTSSLSIVEWVIGGLNIKSTLDLQSNEHCLYINSVKLISKNKFTKKIKMIHNNTISEESKVFYDMVNFLIENFQKDVSE